MSKNDKHPQWIKRNSIMMTNSNDHDVYYTKKQRFKNNIQVIWYWIKRVSPWIITAILVPIGINALSKYLFG